MVPVGATRALQKTITRGRKSKEHTELSLQYGTPRCSDHKDTTPKMVPN